MVPATSSVVVAESSTASGGSFTGLTVIDTVPTPLYAAPSPARKWKESSPL
jgi:hypothetical protein